MDLLADRFTQIVGLEEREAGDLLGDLHVLLLVDRDAERRAGDRLQPRIDVRDRLLAVLAPRVTRDVRHRARAVERNERDQIFELRRLDLRRSASRIPDDSNWKTPIASPRREHLVDLLVVERQLGVVEPVADQLLRLLEHVEVAQAEEVDLQQPERLDVAAGELGHDLLVGALLLQRDVLRQRLVADHDAGSMDRVRAHEPFQRSRQVDDLAGDRIGVVLRLQLLARLQARIQRLPRSFRNGLGDLVDDAVGNLEHASRIAHRSARGHRREGDDLRDAVASVLLGDVVDDAVASVDCEVDVGVRQSTCVPG